MAIGIVSAIVTFLDVGVKVVKGAIEIRDSASSSTLESRSAAKVAQEMNDFVDRFGIQHQAAVTTQEKSLCVLAKECSAIAYDITELTRKTTAAEPKSWTSSLRASLKTKKYEGERRRLLGKLSDCRSQLDLQLSYWTRFVSKCPRPVSKATIL